MKKLPEYQVERNKERNKKIKEKRGKTRKELYEKVDAIRQTQLFLFEDLPGTADFFVILGVVSVSVDDGLTAVPCYEVRRAGYRHGERMFIPINETRVPEELGLGEELEWPKISEVTYGLANLKKI